MNGIIKYHVLLPTAEAHHAFHQTHGASYAHKVHPKLIAKIYELVFEGTTDVQEAKRPLKHYVTHVLCCSDFKPDLTDHSYYPTSTDIQNDVYKAQKACQLSKLDQENLN